MNLIVAAAKNRVIGQGGTMPWHYSADLKWFKQKTMGGVLIMGRKTFESLPGKLPGREIVVVSRRPQSCPNQCPSLADACYLASKWPSKPIWIVGGGEVYREALAEDLPVRIFLTEIPEEPPIDENTVLLPDGFLDGFQLVHVVQNEQDPRLLHKVYRKCP